MKNKELIIANLESVSNLTEYYVKAINGTKISPSELVEGLEELKKKTDYVLELINVS
ncbi:MAG: hypothetical protein H8E98_03010 [Bacteroidetes bacterium]|nr:hypothetical protein [Bacteroidota bacterium]